MRLRYCVLAFAFAGHLHQAQAQTQAPDAAPVQAEAHASRQDWYRDANKDILALQQRRDFGGALARSEALLARVISEYGATSFDAAVVLSLQGHIHEMAGKMAEAAQAYERSLALMQALFGALHPQVAVAQANLGQVYSTLKRLPEAKALLEKALAGAEQAERPEGETVRQVLDVVSSFNANYGDRAVAQSQAERLLPLTRRVAGARSDALLAAQIKLAQVFALQNKMAELDAFADDTIAGSAAENGETDTFTIQSIANFAKIYTQLSRLDKAETLYRRTITLSEQKFGPEHQFTVANFILLADILLWRGADADAAAFYSKALASWEKAFGANNYGNHDVLLNYGIALRRASRFEEAERAFRRAIEVSAKALGDLHPLNAKPRLHLAGLYRELGRLPEAETLYKGALEADRKVYGDEHGEVALILDNLAVLYRDMGRYAEAESLGRQALETFERLGGEWDANALYSLNNLAATFKVTGRLVEAVNYLQRAIDLIAKIPTLAENPITPRLYDNLAGALADRGDREQAAIYHQKAYEIFLRLNGPDSGDVAIASHNIGSLYFDMGNIEKAREWFETALRTYEHVYGRKHALYAGTLRRLAELHEKQNAPDQALPLLEEALGIAAEVLPDDHPTTIGILVEIGDVQTKRGDFVKAYDAYAKASEIIIRRWRNGRTNAIGEPAFRGLLRTSGKLENAPGQDRERLLARAFDAAQWIGNTRTAGALTQMSARFAAGDGPLASAVRTQQDQARELAAIEDKLTQALAPPATARRDEALVGYLRGKRGALIKSLASLDETLRRDFAGYAELSRPAPMTLEAIRSLLSKDELFIQYALDDDSGHIWVVGANKISSHRLALTRAEVETGVARLRCGLDDSGWASSAKDGGCQQRLGRPIGRGGTLPFDFTTAHALYKALIGPFEAESAGKQLLIVPSEALTSLPFQVLIREPAAKQFASDMRSYAQARWLGVSNAITILPAASSLKALREFARRSPAREPYVGYGDPKLTGVPSCPKVEIPQSCDGGQTPVASVAQLVSGFMGFFRAGQADTIAVSSLCPLPDTAHELKCVARSVGAAAATIHTGLAATETAVKQASTDGTLQTYRVVHFATHGLLAGETQLIDKSLAEPALVLSPPATPQKDDDGLLTASEVAQLKLNSDWVILSACNTASGDHPGAEALSGLTRAFFYAGTRALLVSHWPVNSTAAVKLTTGAFAAMRKDARIGRGEAMRRSIRALIEGGQPWEAHPSVWAPFIVVGEGAAGDGGKQSAR